MSLRTGLGRTLIGLVLLALPPAAAHAAPTVTGEFAVSGIESNNKIVEGPDGAMWVTLSGGVHDVARIDPVTGAVEERSIGPGNGTLSAPSGIASVHDDLWVTAAASVTNFSPADPPTVHETISMPALVGSSPIVLGPDGNLWVATNGALLRFPPGVASMVRAGEKEFSLPGLGPRDIDVAGNLLAVADFGGSLILTSTTDGATIGKYPLSGGPQGVAGNPSGQIAYSQPSAEPKEVGLLTPPGTPVGTKLPGTDAFGAALGPDGAYWFAEGNSDKLIRLSPTGQETELRGFAPGGKPRQIAAGPGNTLWVTLEGSNKVARVSGVVKPPEPPTVPPPRMPPPRVPSPELQTQISQGPKGAVRTARRRALVRLRFSASDPRAGFECRLTKLSGRRPRAAAVPSFAPCGSPKSYRLKPGRYRFEVRAALAGIADSSPAARSFRVVRIAAGRHR